MVDFFDWPQLKDMSYATLSIKNIKVLVYTKYTCIEMVA